MRRFKHGGLRGLALAVFAMAAFSIATPIRAQDSESQRLAADIVGSMFEVMDFRGLIVKGMAENSGELDGLNVRPEWPEMLKNAMLEEVDHDLPAIKAIFSRRFAAAFTVEELRAGSVMMRDPALQAVMAAGAAGKPAPKGIRLGRDAERAGASRAGRSFLDKAGKVDVLFADAEPEFLAEVLPGTFRRFADKAEAAEIARRATSP